jgi:hypothetical protein
VSGYRVSGHYEASFSVNSGPGIVSYAIEHYDDWLRRTDGAVVVKYTRTIFGARFGAWWREMRNPDRLSREERQRVYRPQRTGFWPNHAEDPGRAEKS